MLKLGGNQISDISPLASLTNLGDIHIWENKISDISPLASLTNLRSPYIHNNQISDISPLASLKHLQEIRLDGNQISGISPLVQNSGLGDGDKVYLSSNNVDLAEDSEDLENIKKLEQRGVGFDTGISDCSSGSAYL